MQDDGDQAEQRAVLIAAFGKRLMACRHLARLSQAELADHAELHRTEIGLVEAGQREPRLSTVIKLAYALDISAAELLQGAVWSPTTGFALREVE